MNTYKIITLGASGSGKTVFLSSMFKALGIQADHGFYLQVKDSRQKKLLNAIYTEIIAGEIWPKGTRYSEISEWSYICRVKNPKTLEYYDACEFVYFDYAGGRLTDINEEDTEFKNIIKQSDAILGLLDGKKIYDLMNNNKQSDVDSLLIKDLPGIIKWMSYSQVPIHFVISKWDLLEAKFSLQQIRDRLLEIPEFQMLIYQRNQANSPVRLIPVSSVGSNFATLAPDGSMEKIPGAVPKPFQVEVPISCVFPDRIKAQLSELLQKKEKLENQKLSEENVFWKFGGLILDIAFDQVLEHLPLFEYFPDKKIAKVLIGKLDNFFFSIAKAKNKENIDKLKVERDSSLEKVKDEETALNHAIDSFLYIQGKLEQDFPESELIV
jgi:hypothetical protein